MVLSVLSATASPGAPAGSLSSLLAIPLLLATGFSLYFLIFLIRFAIKRRVNVKEGKIRKYNPVFIILCALGNLVDFLILGLINGWKLESSNIALSLILLFIPGIVTQCICFLPYLIANIKSHPQETAIFVLNLLAGWTIIAWIIALVWAFAEPKRPVDAQQGCGSKADELRKYKDLLDSGAISQEEFDLKKNQLLNT